MDADTQNLRTLIREAGFETQRMFAEAAGLEEYEVSRLCGDKWGRPPTAEQLRKIARPLRLPLCELAGVVFPEDSLERDLIDSSAAREQARHADEREAMQRKVESIARKLEETEEKLVREREEHDERMAEMRKENDRLRGQLVESEARAAVLPTTGAHGTDGARAAALPPATTMAASLFGAVGRVARQALRGGHVLATDEVTLARLAVCRAGRCGQYLKDRDRCVDCGCFVSAKAKLATETCPFGHWSDQPEVPEAAATERVVPQVTAHPSASEVTKPTHPGHEAGVGQPNAAGAPPPLLARFFSAADKCGACAPVRDFLASVRTRLGPGTLEVIELEVSQEPRLVQEHGVAAVPTVLFYRDGEFLHRQEGLPTEQELLAELAKAAPGAGFDTLAATAPAGVLHTPEMPTPDVPQPGAPYAGVPCPEGEQARAELAFLSRSGPYGNRTR